ncbi:MAG: Hint domain-containing protein [Aliishimia sp.]
MVANINGIIISQIYGDNSGGAVFDTDGDGTATQEDEFVSIQNTSSSPMDLSGWQIWSDMTGASAPDDPQDGLYHTFPPGTTLEVGKNLYIVNEITGTPTPTMQEASEGGLESGAGGVNTNFLSEGGADMLSEGIALVNPATGEYIVIEFNENGLTDFPGMSGFPGTTLLGTSNAAADSGQEDMNAGSSYQYNSATDQYEYSTVAVVCFAQGTKITVPEGECLVEDLKPGDLILTLDRGFQPLQKSLRRHLNFAMDGNPCHKPIEFKRGALGSGMPTHCLVVSPQHRMLVKGTDGKEVLVPAKALTKRVGVRAMKGCREVTYVHLVFRRHEIIKAHGCWSESFYPGLYATSTFGCRLRMELMEVFPELKRDLPVEPARTLLSVGEAQMVFQKDFASTGNTQWETLAASPS